MRLTAALNGRLGKRDHPAVPVTTLELAADSRAAVAAGADGIHLHVRDPGGAESLDAYDLDRTLAVVRQAVPDTPIGVSTGAWIEPDPRHRLERVREWNRLPDFASLNWHEHGSEDVARVLASRGVAIEVGLWDGTAAVRLARDGRGRPWLRLLIEPMEEETEEARRTVTEIEEVLAGAGLAPPRALHGTGRTAWPLLRLAAEKGWQTRIGLEDTLELPDGSPAPDNAALVRAARKILDAHRRL